MSFRRSRTREVKRASLRAETRRVRRCARGFARDPKPRVDRRRETTKDGQWGKAQEQKVACWLAVLLTKDKILLHAPRVTVCSYSFTRGESSLPETSMFCPSTTEPSGPGGRHFGALTKGKKFTSPERTSRDCLLIRFSEIPFNPSLDHRFPHPLARVQLGKNSPLHHTRLFKFFSEDSNIPSYKTLR